MITSVIIMAMLVAALPTEPPPLGTRIPSPNPLISEAPIAAGERESYEVAQKLGACLVKADPVTSTTFVIASPGSAAGKFAVEKLQRHMSGCLVSSSAGMNLHGTVTMQIYPRLLRGTIAEGLYRLQFRGRAQPARTHLSVAPIYSEAPADDADRSQAILYEFAQCVTAASPGAAQLLSLSAIGSSNEREAYAVLVPAMSPCLYKGTTLKADRLSFRFILAEALYRWSLAAVQLVPEQAR
jgi:hypothetical protein